MKRRLPPYPSGNLQQWALALVDYLQRVDGVDAEILPEPILLQHLTGDEKALQDGLVMFEPTLKVPVYSAGGVWRTFDNVPVT